VGIVTRRSANKVEHRLLVALTCVLLTTCIDGFTTRSAYEDEVYLCDDDAAFAELVDDCRARNSGEVAECGGVISLRGALEGQPVTITTSFDNATFTVTQTAEKMRLLDRIDATGPSPYFILTIQLKSLGGSYDEEPTPRTLILDPGAREALDPLRDDRVSVSLRLSTGGDSSDLQGQHESGELVVDLQREVEFTGSFSGAFGPEKDDVSACVHLFALELVTIVESPEDSLSGGYRSPRSYNTRSGIPPTLLVLDPVHVGRVEGMIDYKLTAERPLWLWFRANTVIPHDLPESPLPGSSVRATAFFLGLDYRG
jgi:hypothetical protein